jgi:small-conductance mechanosensitive channel
MRTLSPTESLIAGAIALPVIYLALVAIGRWLKRSQKVPLGIPFQLFAIVFAIWVPLTMCAPHLPIHAGFHRALTAAVALLGVHFGLSLVHRYFWDEWFVRQYQAAAPKFLRQLCTLLVFIVALLVVLQGIFQADIRAAVAASGVLAVVLGLAMQDTLSNIIAGISLEIGKPFKVGDWLIVDGQHAEVMEVNWRSTRLRTNDDIYLDIPNKTIVGSTIRNLTYPTRQHGIRLFVHFDYNVPPNFVKDCLQHATATAFGVAAKPPPKVFLRDFADSAIQYEIKFTMEDEARYNDICDSIRTNVWYEAQRRGLRIPYPIRTLQIDRRKPAGEDPVATARMSARQQPILQLLDDAQFDKLLRCARLQRFGRGEKVLVQGECGQSMFIVFSGEAEVLVQAGGVETRVATLRTGDAFGEMSLLTGEPRSATVMARTDCELWEIDKTTLGEILQENTALVERLGELLAMRRLENEGLLATAANQREMESKQQEYKRGFLRKLSVFFEL